MTMAMVQLSKKKTLISRVNPGRSANIMLRYDPVKQAIAASYDLYRDGVKHDSGVIALDLSALVELLANYLATKVPTGTTGFGWSDITSAASSIVKKVGASKIVKTVQSVMDSPVGTVLESVVPGLSIANETWKAAKTLVDSVSAGDEYAKTKLVEVADMAKEGHEGARKLLIAAKVVRDAVKAGSLPPSRLLPGKVKRCPRCKQACR